MAGSVPTRFGFDTVFDDAGAVAFQSAPRRISYSAAEVEQIRATAFAEGETSAVARAEADAQADIARAARSALTALSRVAHEHRQQCAGLALAAARAIAGAALDRF